MKGTFKIEFENGDIAFRDASQYYAVNFEKEQCQATVYEVVRGISSGRRPNYTQFDHVTNVTFIPDEYVNPHPNSSL